MLEEVKEALRVSGDDLNTEVTSLIEAAKFDLRISGVNKINDGDPLIKRAIITYCKAHFGYEDVNVSERFERAYIMLKQHLSLSGEYGDVDEET